MKNSHPFKILIDRLKNEQTQSIDEKVDANPFLKVNESELHFEGIIHVTGYCTFQHKEIILSLNLEAFAHSPCTICNEDVTIPIKVKNLIYSYHTDEIKTETLDYSDEVRDGVLLQTPQFVECQGNCQKRADLDKYLIEEKRSKGHKPFEGINLDEIK